MSDESHHIDGLEIDHLLARGGSASVYEAFDRRHSRKVAVKVLDSRDLEEPKRRAFRRELEAMGRLDDHPYVLSVFDSGFTEDGSPYLVMPLVSTGTVAQRISRGEAFAIDELLSIAVKLASALETAHRRGILHCDIKPSNLFIGPFGDPMLGDLGISSVADSGVTATNRVSITLRYAAPEVVEGADHTVASDIYSLGTTMFTMLDLQPPFTEKSKAALVTHIVSGQRPPRLERDVPDSLGELIYEMMAVEPDARPVSALRVVERLQAIEAERGNAPTTAALEHAERSEHQTRKATPATPAVGDLTGSRRSRALIAGLVAALLLAAGAFALANRSASDSTAAVRSELITASPARETPPAETAPTQTPTTSAAAAAVAAPTTPPAAPATAVETLTPEPAVLAAVEAATPVPTPAATATTEPDEVAGITVQADDAAVQANEPELSPTITGSVAVQAESLLEPIGVELFERAEGRPRGDFIQGVDVDSAGQFGFAAPVGCYVVTFVAPEGFIVDGTGRFLNVPTCVDDASTPVVLGATVSPELQPDAVIRGSVWAAGLGLPAADVHVDVFIADGPGQRGAFVSGTDTGPNGSYNFDVVAGCYILTFTAPQDRTLVGGGEFLNSPNLCVDAQETELFEAEVE